MSEILEALTKTEVWVSLCLGIIVPWLLKRLRLRFERFTQRLPEFKSEAAQKLKGWLKSRLRKHLLKLKSKRFDQTAINREIAKTYAALVIFCIYASIWMVFVMLQKLDKGSLLMAMIPALIAEAFWITKSAHVDSLIRSAKRLRHNARRIERLLDAREDAKHGVQRLALEHHPLSEQARAEAHFDDDSFTGTVWIWATARLAWDPERCIAGYDFSYEFDPELGKKRIRFEPTDKPLLADREIVRRKPAPQPQT